MPLQSALIGAGNTIKSVVVLLSSMTPILENKGSILLGAALNLKWYLAYIGSSIGSFLPVPFLLRAGPARSKKAQKGGGKGDFPAPFCAFSKRSWPFEKRRALWGASKRGNLDAGHSAGRGPAAAGA